MQLLFEWLKETTAVILVLPASPPSCPVVTLFEKAGYFENLLEDQTKQLAIVISGSKAVKFMSKEERIDWESRSQKKNLDFMCRSLLEASCARDKLSTVTSFVEDSGRFTILHFYRYRMTCILEINY